MLDCVLLVTSVAAGLAVFGRTRGNAPAVLGFLLLAAGMTSPLLLAQGRMMLDAGVGQDAFIGVWNLWWTREAITALQNPMATDWLFHPEGTSLALHTHAVTWGVLTIPLQWLLGSSPPGLFAVYNLAVLASFTLAGWFTFRLAREITADHGAAVLAGAVFAFLAFRFANTVRLHVLGTEWLVLFAWAWVRFVREPGPPSLAGAAGAYVLLLYSSLEYAAYAVLLALVLAAPRLWQRREPRGGDRRPWIAYAGILLGAAAVATPFWIELITRLRQGDFGFDPRLTAFFSADLLDFVVPNPRHPIWGAGAARLTAGFHDGDAGFGVSLGWVLIGLAITGGITAARARRNRRWLAGAALFLVLSLGPALHVAGTVHDGVPLPQRWLASALPFLGGSRTPIRYIAPAALCLAVVAAVGLAGRRRKLALAWTSLALLESLAAPLPLTQVSIPGVYREVASLAASESRGALLHLPGMPERENLLYQTVHGQPLVEDVGSAIPLHSPRPARLEDDRRWRALALDFARPGLLDRMAVARREAAIAPLRAFLRERGIRFVVVPAAPDLQAAGSWNRLPPELLGRPAYDAYRANLRHLAPKAEHEIGAFTLFEL